MPSRIALFSSLVLLAACGPQQQPTIQQPLTTGCAALDHDSCIAQPECELADLTCIAVCVDPGDGGCESACANMPVCQARVVAPPACSTLDRPSCEANPSCIAEDLACIAVCVDRGDGGCESACPDAFRCTERHPTPATCESFDTATCSAHSECEVITAVCTAICEDDGHGGCLPCNAPSVCVTRQVNPLNCYGLDPNTCDLHPECEFVASPCGECPPNALCFCSTEPSCQPRVVEPISCASVSDESTCNTTPGCEFVLRDCDCSGALCDCPGIATCQPIQEPGCYGLDPNTCDQHPECEFYAAVCNCVDALCDCPIIEPSCQPRRSPCDGLDAVSCANDSRCEMINYACPAVCIEDPANPGACLPCEVPPDACVERNEPPVVGCGGGGGQPPAP